MQNREDVSKQKNSLKTAVFWSLKHRRHQWFPTQFVSTVVFMFFVGTILRGKKNALNFQNLFLRWSMVMNSRIKNLSQEKTSKNAMWHTRLFFDTNANKTYQKSEIPSKVPIRTFAALFDPTQACNFFIFPAYPPTPPSHFCWVSPPNQPVSCESSAVLDRHCSLRIRGLDVFLAGFFLGIAKQSPPVTDQDPGGFF